MAKEKRERLTLTEVIQEAIRGSGLSLNRLSEVAGVDPTQLSRFMRGMRTITLPIAEKLCEVLHLDLVSRGDVLPAGPSEEAPGKKSGKRKGE
jgi:transcriptional regulator with XRE-family HTH domain